MANNKYKRLVDGRTPYETKGPAKKDIKPSMTVQGQAVRGIDLMKMHANGFPLPMQRPALDFPEDVNNILQGEKFDVPNPLKYQKMSLAARQNVKENLRNLKQHITQKLDAAVKQKEILDAQIQEQNPAPPAPPETPST